MTDTQGYKQQLKERAQKLVGQIQELERDGAWSLMQDKATDLAKTAEDIQFAEWLEAWRVWFGEKDS